MAKRASKKAAETPPTESLILDQPVEGRPYLAVRNNSDSVQILGSLVGQPDLILALWQETVLGGAALEAWKSSRTLRAALKSRALVGKWVDFEYVAKALPASEDAPADAQPDTHLDRAYAHDILQSDLPNALELINAQSTTDGNTPNLRYLKDPFQKILAYVEWAEPQMQNRPEVLAAVRERVRLIKAL